MSENKFSVGDKVVRTTESSDLIRGQEYTVSESHKIGLIKVVGCKATFNSSYFELVEENKMQKQFTKNDLRDWMRVVTRSGLTYIVNKPHNYLLRVAGMESLGNFHDNLDHISDKDWDIVEVNDCPSYGGLDPSKKGDLLWKREEKSPEQIEAENITKEIESLKLRLEELSKRL